MHTILIIDDDDVLRNNYKEALETHGYRVLEASSGNGGFELAQQHLPDLILTDIAMPNGDGQSVLKKIRQDPVLGRKQVVMFTGDLNNASPRKGMEAGADDFLLKPVNLDSLIKCVEARLARAAIHWRVEDSMLAQLRLSLDSTLPHEFYTPLAGIIGLSEVLCSGPTASPETIKELSREIRASALRLHQTVSNHLMLLELDRENIDHRPTNLTNLTPAVVHQQINSAIREVLSRQDRIKDVKILLEDVSLQVDATDLRMIVLELLDYACEFSRPSSAIIVRLESTGVLIVEDTGREMTADEIAQLNISSRSDPRRRDQPSLGIGLFLVQKLAALYGAELSIESHPSEGTQMIVTFRTD